MGTIIFAALFLDMLKSLAIAGLSKWHLGKRIPTTLEDLSHSWLYKSSRSSVKSKVFICFFKSAFASILSLVCFSASLNAQLVSFSGALDSEVHWNSRRRGSRSQNLWNSAWKVSSRKRAFEPYLILEFSLEDLPTLEKNGDTTASTNPYTVTPLDTRG